MKTILLSFLLLLSAPLLAQLTTEKYIALEGAVGYLGGISISYVEYPKMETGKIDTIVNKKAIDAIVEKHRNRPLNIINELAKDGWSLVSTTFIKNPDGSNDAGTMLYYLRKRFNAVD